MKCPVCNGTKSRLLFPITDHFSTGERFSLYECQSCRVVSTFPLPDPDKIQRYYDENEYISHKTSSRDPLYKMLLFARRLTMYLRRRLVEKDQPSPGSILDVGCGTGAFLAEMKRAGWHIDGIEANESARTIAIQQLDVAVQGPAKLDTLEKTYDAVTLWHVLEHLHNIPHILEQLYSLLKPGGRLCIAVPNRLSTDARIYGPHWAAYDVPRHLYHFTPFALEKLFTQYGFRPVRKNRLALDPFYISFLSERYKSGRALHPRAVYSAILSSVNSLFHIDRSSSLLYTFKKSS